MSDCRFGPPDLGQRLWFDEQDYKEDPRWAALSPNLAEQVQRMHDDGYVVIDSAVSNDVVDRALAAFGAWKETNSQQFNANRKANGDPPRLVDFHGEEDAIAALFYKNASLPPQDAMFGGETSIYTSLFFEVSTEQPIHRDVPVFRTSPENFYFGMWVALEDATVINGALRVIKGGHKVPTDKYAIGRKFYDDPFDVPNIDESMWNAYQAAVSKDCLDAGLSITYAEVKRGQTLIWHPMLPHGGGKIAERGMTRNSIVFHTVPLGVPVYRQSVFFNEHAKDVTRRSTFKYESLPGGRYYAEFGGTKLVGR